ncbi:aminopeptidase [Candidatus Woesearchaeota archaeon]|nr:aminopeptidase [Candidatus Woesearchaeota archaeon]
MQKQRIKEIVNQSKFKNKIRIDVFKKILTDNLKAKNEQIIIIGDKGREDRLISPIMTNAYSLAAEELGLNYETIYQNFKTRGESADAIVVKKLMMLPNKSIIIVNISNRIGSLGPLGLSFRKFCADRQHRFISSSSLGSIDNKKLSFLIDCLDIDYKEIEKKTKRLEKILSEAKEINITTKIGTNITFGVKGMPGKSATGIYSEPGTGGNLPGSEVYIAPKKNEVNGRVYIDGSLRIKNKTILLKEPVRLDISKGSITSMNNTYEARQLLETLRWAQKKAKNPDNVWKIGELGIGLNKKAKVIGSTIIDEKTYKTAHIAIGSNSWFGGDIKTFIHLDQVFHDPIIKIDGKLLKY